MKVRRRSPDAVMWPRLVSQRCQEIVVAVAVPLVLLFGSELEIGVGPIDHSLRNGLQPLARCCAPLPQGSVFFFSKKNFLLFLGWGPNPTQGNQVHFKKLFACAVRQV